MHSVTPQQRGTQAIKSGVLGGETWGYQKVEPSLYLVKQLKQNDSDAPDQAVQFEKLGVWICFKKPHTFAVVPDLNTPGDKQKLPWLSSL